MIRGLPSPLLCSSTTALQVLYDRLMNCFKLCTKRTPRRHVTASWEKHLTLEEYTELNTARESVEAREIELERSFSTGLVQVFT